MADATDTTADGVTRSHCRAAGAEPAAENSDSVRGTVLPGAAVADESWNEAVWHQTGIEANRQSISSNLVFTNTVIGRLAVKRYGLVECAGMTGRGVVVNERVKQGRFIEPS